MQRTFLEGFERGVLFRLTRFVAMAAVFVLLAAIVAGAVMLGSYFRSTDSHVSPDEVVSSIKPVVAEKPDAGSPTTIPQPTSPSLNNEEPLRMPFVLQKYVASPENLEVMKHWLEGLSDSEKSEFLDEMAQAVTAAERAHLEPIDAINRFRELKLSRLSASKKAEEQRNMYFIWYASAAATIMILIALLSLVLVLLAVERNTRQAGHV